MSAPLDREYRAEMPLGLIDPPELDARLDRDEAKLDELAKDIRHRGLIFPIAIVRNGERFNVVDGYRRFLACDRAGLVVAPVFIYPTKAAALEGVKYAANAFREEMSPADEANFFDELMKHHCDGDIEKVCALVGKTFNYVSGRLELFGGHPEVFDAVPARKISLGVAAELNKLPDKAYLAYYLDSAIRSGATITAVQGWIQEWKRVIGDVPQAPAAPPSETTIAPGSTDDPFACIICGKSDHYYAIRQKPIHTHCELAILRPLLNHEQG